jgi:predicted Zn-dependent protease
MPARAEERLGEGVLEFLDGGFLRPTALSEPERAEVERVIAEAARRGAPGVRYRLLFRSMEQKPDVNAFALPGGTVVLLDGLVRRTGASDRLVAVVGHELGHVARRHSTRSFLRAAGVGVVTSMLWGDISGQAATLPAVMAMLDYSRDAEREADDDAVRFLRAAGLSPRAMHDAFCLLAAVERKSALSGIPRILSSHPGLDERLARVRALGAPGEVPQACEETDAAAGDEDEAEAGDGPATCAPGRDD